MAPRRRQVPLGLAEAPEVVERLGHIGVRRVAGLRAQKVQPLLGALALGDCISCQALAGALKLDLCMLRVSYREYGGDPEGGK